MPTKTKQPKSAKPKKPYPDFPLTPHVCGQWCYKIQGEIHYFGTDPDEALRKYLDERDDLQAGRTPRRRGKITLEQLCFQYLDNFDEKVKAGERAQTTLNGYVNACKLMTEHLGRTTDPELLRPDDFN